MMSRLHAHSALQRRLDICAKCRPVIFCAAPCWRRLGAPLPSRHGRVIAAQSRRVTDAQPAGEVPSHESCSTHSGSAKHAAPSHIEVEEVLRSAPSTSSQLHPEAVETCGHQLLSATPGPDGQPQAGRTWLLSLAAVTAGAGAFATSGFDMRGPGSTLVAVLTMATIVAVHETGHFLAARLQGIRVKQFSIGFGPPLWKYKGADGIEFTVNAFPLGGYVAFPVDENERDDPSSSRGAREAINKAGKGPGSSVGTAATQGKSGKAAKWDPDDPDLLENRPVLQRAFVVGAGVAANVLFALAVLFLQVTTVGKTVPQFLPGVQVPSVSAGSPADRAGLRDNDVILSVGGTDVPATYSQVRDVVTVIGQSTSQPLTLLVDRQGERIQLSVTPVESVDGRGRIGAQLNSNFVVGHEKPKNVLEAVKTTGSEFKRLFSQVASGLSSLVTNFAASSSRLNGPVAIVAAGSEIVRTDSAGLFQFCALININLAIVNALPLPALDGGYMALLALEALRGGKKLPQEFEQSVTASGVLLLVLLGVGLVVRDTLNLL